MGLKRLTHLLMVKPMQNLMQRDLKMLMETSWHFLMRLEKLRHFLRQKATKKQMGLMKHFQTHFQRQTHLPMHSLTQRRKEIMMHFH